jgi:NADPH-dependent 2,4-dienoyl-CoA reductase/sulfur reductase-like enzyme
MVKYLILGAGAAGVSAAETIRVYDKESELVVVSKEDNLPISPVALPEYIEGSISKEELFLWDRGYLEENRIELILGRRVARIDQGKRTVSFTGSKSLAYDRLLIATGASPVLTKDFTMKEKVFTLRTLDDAEGIIKCAKERVIIYGAGAIAVKVAVALRKRGIDVIVICRSRVLRRLFDDDICSMINSKLADNGVRIAGSCQLDSCSAVGDARVEDEELSYDCIVAAMGVKPNVPFADKKSIRFGSSGGISVDDGMQTSAPGIYAAGDCVETLDVTTGRSSVTMLWPPAVEQGKIAAMNMLGKAATYAGTLPSNAIHVFDDTFVTMGSLEGQKVNVMDKGSIIRFTVRDDKIVGCQMVGDAESAGAIASCIRNGVRVKDLERMGVIPYGKAWRAWMLLAGVLGETKAISL